MNHGDVSLLRNLKTWNGTQIGVDMMNNCVSICERIEWYLVMSVGWKWLLENGRSQFTLYHIGPTNTTQLGFPNKFTTFSFYCLTNGLRSMLWSSLVPLSKNLIANPAFTTLSDIVYYFANKDKIIFHIIYLFPCLPIYIKLSTFCSWFQITFRDIHSHVFQHTLSHL